jgi:hypothetical protein
MISTLQVGIHDPHKFYLDFIREIHGRRYPIHPSPGFYAALAKARANDTARWIRHVNGLDDADYFDRQHVFRPPRSDYEESDQRWLYGRRMRWRSSSQLTAAAEQLENDPVIR